MSPSLRKAVAAAIGGGAVAIASVLITGPGGNDGLEGVSYIPYEDIVGVWTVCHGHTGKDIIPGKTYTAAEGQPVTDTFQIARAFGKRHQHVIRAIKCLRCSEEFSTTHFWAVEKINDLGIFDKKQIYYRMDFSGFVMLVMGFNGAKADAVKEAYINAFNWMSAELRKYSESYEAERNAVMLEYMKEKDVASMSGRLLNRWGRTKKPQLLAKLERLERQGQFLLPGFDKGIQA